MASTLAAPSILAAVRDILATDSDLVGLLAEAPSGYGGGPAIYTDGDAPQQDGRDVTVASMYPQLLLTVPSEIPWNTMGAVGEAKWGSSVIVGVKALTQGRNHDVGWSVLGRVCELLDGQPITVTGYGRASIERDAHPPPYAEFFAGLPFRHFPSLWRVYVHQSS